MPNLLDDYQTSTDYSNVSRETLEAKAKLLDAIELNLAAVYHNELQGAAFLFDMIDSFTDAEFKNYFTQMSDII